MEGIFGMDSSFIDSLTSEQLGELQGAKATLDKYAGLYNAWGGGISQDDLKAHLLEVSARQRQEAADAERFRSHLR